MEDNAFQLDPESVTTAHYLIGFASQNRCKNNNAYTKYEYSDSRESGNLINKLYNVISVNYIRKKYKFI